MSLLIPSPPAACIEAFVRSLPAFLSGLSGENRGTAGPCLGENHLGTATPLGSIASPAEVGIGSGGAYGAPKIAAAQEVFVLQLSETANTKGAIHPASSGWRIFAGEGQHTVVGRMIQRRASHGRSDGEWKLTAVHYGQRVADSLSASRALGALPQVLKENYELRLLAIPGLNVEAFWLKAQTYGAHDLMVPFPAAPHQLVKALNREAVYSSPNFLAAIRPLATRGVRMEPGYGG